MKCPGRVFVSLFCRATNVQLETAFHSPTQVFTGSVCGRTSVAMDLYIYIYRSTSVAVLTASSRVEKGTVTGLCARTPTCTKWLDLHKWLDRFRFWVVCFRRSSRVSTRGRGDLKLDPKTLCTICMHSIDGSWCSSTGHGSIPCSSVQRCFTPTETIRLIRDGEPRTATSSFSFTQLLSSEHSPAETMARFYLLAVRYLPVRSQPLS